MIIRQKIVDALADPHPLTRRDALLEAARHFPRASLHLVSLDIPTAFEMPEKIVVHAASSCGSY